MQALCGRTLKCLYGGLDVAISKEAIQNGIADTSRKAFRIHSYSGCVNKGPKRSCYPKAFALLDLMGSQLVSVKNDTGRRPLTEARRDRQVNSRRHQVTDAMNCHGGLVRDHSELV
jgi:hypothetical protein